MPVNIVFPPTSAPGVKPQESAGRLINAFAEKTPVGAPSTIIHRRTAGLNPAGAGTGLGVHTRGFLDTGGNPIWIVNGRAVKFDSSYSVTDLGALTGTLGVTTARNNAAPTNNMVVVTENGCFNLFNSGPPTSFADPDLPSNPTSVCDYDGYFFWSYSNGLIYASDLNAVTVNSLSFTTEQGLNIRRLVRFAGRLYAFGDKWTGVYKDVGSVPFPCSREVTIPRGIVGTHAIAGWEYGWANQLIWVGDDFIVYRLDGYTPTPISTDDVSRDIQRVVLAGNRNNLEAFVYMYERNAIWVLSCHNDFTWEYNLSTGEWNQRQSYNQVGWKACKSIRAFDQWILGDQFTGSLYTLSGSYFLEGTDPLIWQVESGVISQFPRGIVIPRASFDITTGVGSLTVVPHPQVAISWSLDGGFSYGIPVLRNLGGPGEAQSYPYVLNCGLSRGQGIRYRLTVSDPVHVGLSGGVVESDVRTFAG